MGYGWRRFDVRPIPSATRPRETILSAGPVPDFSVVFEGYTGRAIYRPDARVPKIALSGPIFSRPVACAISVFSL